MAVPHAGNSLPVSQSSFFSESLSSCTANCLSKLSMGKMVWCKCLHFSPYELSWISTPVLYTVGFIKLLFFFDTQDSNRER